MSSDFRPRKGNRLFGTWPRDEDPPAGWERSGSTPLIWRVATGEPADNAVELIGCAGIGYAGPPDYGVPNG